MDGDGVRVPLRSERVLIKTLLRLMCIGGPNTGKSGFINRFFRPVMGTPTAWTSRHCTDMTEQSPPIVIESSENVTVTVEWTKVRWNHHGVPPERAIEYAVQHAPLMDVVFVFVSDIHSPVFELDIVSKLRPCGPVVMLVLGKCDTYSCAALNAFVDVIPESPATAAFSDSHFALTMEAIGDTSSDDDDDVETASNHIISKQLIRVSQTPQLDEGLMFMCMMLHVGLYSVLKARNHPGQAMPCVSLAAHYGDHDVRSEFNSSRKSVQSDPSPCPCEVLPPAQHVDALEALLFGLANVGGTWQ